MKVEFRRGMDWVEQDEVDAIRVTHAGAIVDIHESRDMPPAAVVSAHPTGTDFVSDVDVIEFSVNQSQARLVVRGKTYRAGNGQYPSVGD